MQNFPEQKSVLPAPNSSSPASVSKLEMNFSACEIKAREDRQRKED